jgi:fused signal recognition particle receptor
VVELYVFVAVLVVAVAIGFVVARGRRSSAPPAGPDEAAAERAAQASGAPSETAAPSAAAIPATRGLGERIRRLFSGGTTDETWRGLEQALIRADVGAKGSADVVARVRSSYRPSMDPAEIVVHEVAAIFEGDDRWAPPPVIETKPWIVLVVGVNGNGKTTTIGKLADRLQKSGRSVAMAASDTFRAAAGEQLGTWADRTGAHLVAQQRGADPGAVAFDAVRASEARGIDVLIVDTAGRLHTRTPLMEELKKVRRVLEKAAGRPPDEVLLVLDATTGQNGIQQARAFTDAVGVTGVVLTKLDGTAKGGIVIAVREELGVPVKLVGTGEGVEDLAPFEAEAFARRLVS